MHSPDAVAPAVTDEGGLRTVYRMPGQPALDKQLDHLDEHCRAFVAHAPLVMLGTVGADGRCDVSPRGGPPGFVAVLDEHRLALPDLAGNNRLDSLGNVVATGQAGLLFLIPGLDETLRVNGAATVTVDADVLDACALTDRGVRPKSALVVQVAEAYVHCAKAFRRAGAWDPGAWPDRSDLPSAACMLRDHIKLPLSVDETEAALEAGYAKTLWHA